MAAVSNPQKVKKPRAPVDLVPSSPAPRKPWPPEASASNMPLKSLGELPIVLEHGSSAVRAGLAGNTKSDLVFPSLMGRPKSKFVNKGFEKPYYLGEEVPCHIKLLDVIYPMQHGMVQDFEHLEILWTHCFKRLLGHRDISELIDHRLLVSSRQMALSRDGADDREKLAELALEKFGFKACHVALPAVLCLYPGGELTATVVDSGEGTTQIVPVYEGYYMRHAVTNLDVGGRDLTASLANSLMPKHTFDSRNFTDMEVLRKIKECLCYVAGNYSRKLDAWTKAGEPQKKYEIPGGNSFTMGRARFHCAEALFSPKLLNKADHGLARSIVDSISKCDKTLTKTMYENIVLAGGNSLLIGFEKRLLKDVKKLVLDHSVQTKLAVKDLQQMTNAAWLGGSIFASKPYFASRCLSKEDAFEIGYHVAKKYF